MDLFRVTLSEILDHKHHLIQLAHRTDWSGLEKIFSITYTRDIGRPGISTRLMVALHYLKYTYQLSDQRVVDGWVENPYWQYFSGMKWFEHAPPINPSSMTRWRTRLRKANLESSLKKLINKNLLFDS